MDFVLTGEQSRFRDELRAYFAKMMTDELKTELATNLEAAAPSSAAQCGRWDATGCSG
jgi:hypothetical protein